MCCSIKQHSFDFFQFIDLNNDKFEKIFVIGGAIIYQQMFEYCDYIIHTKFKKTYQADLFVVIPNIDCAKCIVNYEDTDIVITTSTLKN